MESITLPCHVNPAPSYLPKSNLHKLLFIALAYFAANKLALVFPDAEKILAAIWPAGGIGLAALLLSPRRFWPHCIAAIFIAGNIANLTSGRPLINSLVFMTANCLESLCSAWLLIQWCGEDIRFNRIREILALLFMAVAVNACTTSIGAGIAAINNVSSFGKLWLTWWIADGMGILIITPLIISWSHVRISSAHLGIRHSAESFCVMLMLIFMAFASFHNDISILFLGSHPYLMFIVLAWAVLRLGQTFTITALAVVTSIAVTGDAITAGPLIWGGSNPQERLIQAQLFLGVVSATVLLLEASFLESKAANLFLRNSEEALKELSQRLQLATASAGLGVWDWNIKDNVVYWDDQMLALYGLTRQTFPDGIEAWQQGLHPADREATWEACQAALRGERTWDIEFRIIQPDKTVRWVKANGKVIRDPDGQPVRMLGINQDITERKLAEAESETLSLRMRAIFHNLPMMAWLKDTDGRLEMVNVPFAQSCGRAVGECIGKTDTDLFPPELAEKYLADDRDVCSTGKGRQSEEQICTPQGVRWAYTCKTPILDGAGGVVGTAGIALDITERKKIEEALRENERVYHNLYNNSEVAMFRTRMDGSEVLNANEKWLELVGMTREEAIGKPSRIHWVAPERRTKMVRMLKKKGRVTDFEFQLINNKLGVRDCLISLNLYPDEGILEGSILDITERKMLEEQTKRDAARLECLLRIAQYNYDSIQDLLNFALGEVLALTQSKLGYIYHYDENLEQFTLNSWSREVMKECGIIAPQSVYNLAETGLWGEAVRQHAPIIINDYHLPNPHKKGHPEGHVALHSFMSVPVFKRDAIVAVVGVANKEGAYSDADVRQLTLMMDVVWKIVEQDRADKALRASEMKYRNLLESIHLIAVILDTAGNITFCNNYLLDLTGWTSDEILGKNWFDLFIPSKDREAANKVFAASVKANPGSHYEAPLLCRDGRERLIFWNNTTLCDSDGSVTGVASIGSDLTDQRSTEEQLRQAQKMESIGLLAGGVAHDFNNILTVISGYCGLLRTDCTLGDAQKQHIEEMSNVADKAAQLTHGLLAFSRKQTLVFRNTDLNDIVLHIQKFLVRIIGEDIQLYTTCFGKNLPVHVDSGQIDQVLVNLATNARDAMPKGGTLSIGTDLTELDQACIDAHGYGVQCGAYAVLTVTDTGIGIKKKDLKRIFEPFFTTKEVGKGTGLGMAIIYGIVRQHNGCIDVRSKPGEGTTFRIYLPIVEAPKKLQGDCPETAPLVNGTETILVVEDEETVRNLVENLLRRYGYEVILAKDGQDAIAKFAAHKDKIKLILMDLIMPEKNGKDAYEEISRISPDVKVLFCSGYTADFIESRGISEEGIELIMKPVQLMELLRKMRKMLDA